MTTNKLHSTKMLSRAAMGVGGIALCLVLGACADKRGGPIPYDVALGAPDAPKLVPLDSAYRIAPMDTLGIKVFKMPDLSGDYEVDLMGQISMPLIGSVLAADLTPDELHDKLAQKLGA